MKKFNKPSMMNIQKIAECNKADEAKARRKANADWQKLEATGKYRKAMVRSVGKEATDRIAAEVLDGIFLNLNAKNGEKSAAEQKRLLRRIVEKRQAQAVHSKIRKSRDRKAAIAVMYNSSKCMERINSLRFAV